MIEYTVRVYDGYAKFWYLNDELHHEDGPAVECANGDKFWYLNGKHLTEQEFNDRGKCNKVVTIDGVDYELKEVVK